jgi:hypothetical protein
MEMALDAIHEGLVRTLEQQAATSSIVTQFVRNAWSGLKADAISVEPGDTSPGHIDDAIVKVLGDYLFSSMHSSIHQTPAPDRVAWFMVRHLLLVTRILRVGQTDQKHASLWLANFYEFHLDNTLNNAIISPHWTSY